ncbi:sensor histidine kinase [Proteiniclasticum ruminis]|uniref:Two-component system, sensor histidine kinase YesM n=2 Tax=Proteiniclasticum TaxID=1155385 RepID=A0A1G8QDJ0_9CLOT|nr:sensor histidine kinase [Proteiniclasticum ruminis]SDJ02832.1 two-component system, sensor histidine kinase YesM [Proteiniclasticum ruminis]
MKELYKSLTIKSRIIILNITILIISISMSFVFISFINRKYTEREVGEAGIQTVNALKGNLSIIFDNVTQFSDLIYFDEDIQSSLRSIDSIYMDPYILSSIRKSLVNMILSGEYLSGVYIFDKYHNTYSSYKNAPEKVNSGEIRSTFWYHNLKKARGNGFFIHKSEGIILYRNQPNYISYIREIGDMNTYETLATLLVTIDARTLESYFEEVSAESNNDFFIVDGKNNYIIPPKNHEEDLKNKLDKMQEEEKPYVRVDLQGDRTILVKQDMGINDWQLVGAFKTDKLEVMAPYYTTAIAIIVVINILFVFISSMILTRLIFKPLSKVGNHMRMVEKGHFMEMAIDKHPNEINELKRIFNGMTLSIRNLIAKVKEEEQIIAKGKLDIINAQINPHFLYNTLDAVSALALMEDYQNCFKITQALGSFYRNSLNSGLDLISIRDEIESIKSYITILNIRYDNNIEVLFDVEEDLLHEKVLKLILQPPVENAIHHGIRSRSGKGTIWINIFERDGEIIFAVSDNGKGMSEKRVEEVLKGECKTGKSGFGLHGQMERIRLYYDIDDPISIHSVEGVGTEVTIRVRRLKEGKK